MLFLLRSFFFQNENLFSVFFCKDLDGLQLLRLLKLLNSPAPGNEDWWMDWWMDCPQEIAGFP